MLDCEQIFEPGPFASLEPLPARPVHTCPPSGLSLRQLMGLAEIAYARTDLPKGLGEEIGSHGSVRQLVHNQIVIYSRCRFLPSLLVHM
jgi:hypothetical protein